MDWAHDKKMGLDFNPTPFAHPTEVISNKVSSFLLFLEGLLLYVRRPVRWDSAHAVILDDELLAIAHEIIRSRQMDRIHIGLDFFDATINRIAAWVIGTPYTQKALLIGLLENTEQLIKAEQDFNYTDWLVQLEELKTMPFGAVWDYYFLSRGVPVGRAWLEAVKNYESRTENARK